MKILRIEDFQNDDSILDYESIHEYHQIYQVYFAITCANL